MRSSAPTKGCRIFFSDETFFRSLGIVKYLDFLSKAALLKFGTASLQHPWEDWKDGSKSSPQKFPSTDRVHRRDLNHVAHHPSGSLSSAACSLDRRFSCWWRRRHPRTPDRPMVIGAASSAVRHRKSGGCWRQHCHRGGRACVPRRVHAPDDQHAARHQPCAL